MRFLSADFETGGLYPRYHAPISFALALWDGDTFVEAKEWIFPRFEDLAYTPKACSINGTEWSAIGVECSEIDLMNSIADWVGSRKATDLPIIAHNAEFDQGFYLACVQRTKLDPLLGGWECTKRRAAVELPDLKGTSGRKSHSLDSVCAHFQTNRVGDVHGATEDAILAGIAYIKLKALRDAAKEAS